MEANSCVDGWFFLPLAGIGENSSFRVKTFDLQPLTRGTYGKFCLLPNVVVSLQAFHHLVNLFVL